MAARAPNNIRRRTDGRYEGRVTIKYRNGTKERKSFYGDTVDDVKEQIRRAQAERRSFKPQNITAGKFLSLWLEAIKPLDGIVPEKPRVRFSTYTVRKQTVERHIRNAIVAGRAFEAFRLDDVQPQHVRQLLKTLSDMGIGGRARQMVYETLRGALNYAVAEEYIEHNPTARVARPAHKAKATAILGDEHFAALLDAIDRSRHRALFLLAVTTGMRQGEILGLRWSAVNFEAGTLAVNATLSRIGKGPSNLKATPPKTDESNREIVLVPDALAALRDHRKALLGRGLACEWVFPTKHGRPIERNNFRVDIFQPLLEKAGCPRVTFHSFRHLVATLLAEAETNPKALQALLGHRDYRTTANIYAKATERMRYHAADKMTSVLERVRAVGSKMGSNAG